MYYVNPMDPTEGSDIDPPDLWRNVGGGISNLIFLRISLINFFSLENPIVFEVKFFYFGFSFIN